MNVSQLFDHWRIGDNPFRGEEARHDAVFARMTEDDALGATHSDFEKIVGDLRHPSAAIVFGEKGSGKTAIRLQMARRIRQHNEQHPGDKVLLVAYDDLNGVLDRFHARIGGRDPLASFEQLKLVDHVDAILGSVTPRLVESILTVAEGSDRIDLGPESRRTTRRLTPDVKRDLLILQAVYDDPARADVRTARLRRFLGVLLPARVVLWNLVALFGWLPAAAYAWIVYELVPVRPAWLLYPFIALLAFWALAVFKVFAIDRLRLRRLGRKVRRQLRVIDRSDLSFARSLAQLDPVVRSATVLPMADSDEPRYAMLERLKRVLGAFGYKGLIIVLDRVDEPTLISGDPARMQAIVWPMLNTKFLQQEGLGIKLLLPVDLRHSLLKESSSFFQGARLDKQNLVERLSWTGAMLYDLAEARLRACQNEGAPKAHLINLFAEEVTRQDVVDALDQMHQPRDAFKFLYRCLTEHCSNVTADDNEWKVPRLVLEMVRKQEAERLQQLYRGIRPA
jgi:hypothetical protein